MDREEFSRRVNAMMDRLYRISYGQLREPQDRMDAVQDALLKAWTARGRLRSPEYFETWLVRILINECHNRQRAKRRAAPMDAAPEPSADDPALDALYGRNAEVRDAVRALSGKLRVVVILYYMEDYGIDEIARILRLPRETVRSRLRRARAALREALAKTDGEGRMG